MEFMNGKLYRLSQWIMGFMQLNLLWIIFTIAGALLFGFYPATLATFAVVRKWIRNQQEEVSIYRTFWSVYKKEFFKSNIIGLILIVGGLILYVDYRFLLVTEGSLSSILFVLMFSIGILYFIVILYVFPVYVHYQIKVVETFKYALLIALSSPLITISMVALVIIDSFITMMYPVIFFFFSISILVFALTGFAHLAFRKFEERVATKTIK